MSNEVFDIKNTKYNSLRLLRHGWELLPSAIPFAPGLKHAGAGSEVSKCEMHRDDSIAYGDSASIPLRERR